ncbi:zinc ribbon domain-containing protein [Streptomyces sp. NPDC096538]|uniref:zinc ribbon domain-containing protein n=1 Tax=Streptomyces sp. NPDC096538 TaxID=3155427 RepID=UPI0033254D90
MTSPSSGPGRTASSCAECGTPAEPGQSFCDSCGAVLGWAGEGRPGRTEPAARTATAGAAPADSAAPGGSAPAATASRTDAPATAPAPARGDGSPSGTTASEDDTEPLPHVPATADPQHTGGNADDGPRRPHHSAENTDDGPLRPHHSAGDSDEGPDDDSGPDPDTEAAERARSLLVPVADAEPHAPEDPDVAPVLPGRTAARRPQVRAVGPQADAEGGVPCPWCSTLNRPERHFCSRCAMSMTRGDDDPARLPWWRRMFADRGAESAWAGERPRVRRGFGRVWNWIVGAVVVGLVIALVMNLGTMIQATRDHFAKRAPIGPSGVKASRSYTGHDAGLAFDKLNNTWWGPGIAQSAEGEWLEVTFDQPTRLLDLVITPGTSTRADQLSESALPRRIDALVTLADGEKITRTLTLDQGAGGQRRKFRVGEVTAVRFILRSAYNAGDEKQVAIAEIEFFGPSNNNS